jgi:hypothetical protein
MARHYEALVQVGFRTKKEVKEKISESANKAGKGMSEYLANFVENIFGSDSPTETPQEAPKNDNELASKMRTLFLELSLSYPMDSATPMQMVDELLKLAKNKKITRVKDW